jgi:hypothetical protein
MSMISRTAPRFPTLSLNRAFFAALSSWLLILKEQLRVGWERECLRTLDQRVKEDLGLASSNRLVLPAGDAPKEISGPLLEIFSWTRFSK